jgi:hypothetical protein
MAGSGVRYRYKGKFVSRDKAIRLGNLPNTKKYLTSEYNTPKPQDRSHRTGGHAYKGYKRPVQALVSEALKRDRGKAQKKIKDALGPKQAAKERRERARYETEQRKAADIAERAVTIAERDDISIGESIERTGFEDGDLESFDFAAIEAMAADYIDYGEEFFDFDMVDLEDEDKYAA